MLNSLHLSQIQKRTEVMAAEGLDTTSLDDEAFDTEAAQDKCIFRLIASCCNGDKLVRAIELVKLLSIEKSIRGAMQLAAALKLPVLAERFNKILEERLRSKTEILNTNLFSSKSGHSVKADLTVSKDLTATERSEISEPIDSSSSAKLSAPLFKKKIKSSDRC